MNGYNDVHTEPADDEEFALACGYEIISEDELYDIISLSCLPLDEPSPPPPPSFWSRSSKLLKFHSKMSITSISSNTTQSSGVSSLSGKSISSLSSHTEEDCFHLAAPDLDDIDEEEFLSSVERIWYMIQKKGHHHDDIDEGLRMRDPILTMEDSSNGKKLTAWFHNLVHFPEKIRQIMADKRRFNIDKVPKRIRDELKHIYVY